VLADVERVLVIDDRAAANAGYYAEIVRGKAILRRPHKASGVRPGDRARRPSTNAPAIGRSAGRVLATELRPSFRVYTSHAAPDLFRSR
jgi:hypothetical protein